MTRDHGASVVHLGMRDWLVIIGLLVPVLLLWAGAWMSLDRNVTELLVRQTYILERLEKLESER